MLISVDETIQTDIKIYKQQDDYQWHPPLHSHNHYEIIFLLSGEADFDIEGKHYHVMPENLLFINRLEKHDITVTKYPYTRYCLSLKQDYCMKIIKNSELLSILFQRPSSFVHVIPMEKEIQQAFVYIFDALIQETYGKDWYSDTAISALVNLFFISLYRHKKAYFPLQPSDTHNVIIEVQRHINLNYMHPIKLDDLAERFFISKYNLCRRYKELTGYSIKDYIVRQRLAHAKSMLANTDLSITEIAEQSGYVNLKQFYRIFAAREGVSPAAYRKAQQMLRKKMK